MLWIGLYKFADVIFGVTQKPLYITSSNLVRLYITNKGICLNLFPNLKSDWSLVPGTSFSWKVCPSKKTGFERKINVTFLRLFDNHSSKYIFFFSNFLHAMAVLGYLPKLRGLGLVLICSLFNTLSKDKVSMSYRSSFSRYQTKCVIKYYSDNWWQRKL